MKKINKTYKPFRLNKMSLMILHSLEESPKSNVELCLDLWGDIFIISKNKGYRQQVSQSLRLLKNNNLVVKKSKWQIEKPNGEYMMKILNNLQNSHWG